MLLKKNTCSTQKFTIFKCILFGNENQKIVFLPLASIEIGHALEKSIYVFFN